LEPEKKKFVGAHTRELIYDMLVEEKRLREEAREDGLVKDQRPAGCN
jgi:hypothetical protein